MLQTLTSNSTAAHIAGVIGVMAVFYVQIRLVKRAFRSLMRDFVGWCDDAYVGCVQIYNRKTGGLKVIQVDALSNYPYSEDAVEPMISQIQRFVSAATVKLFVFVPHNKLDVNTIEQLIRNRGYEVQIVDPWTVHLQALILNEQPTFTEGEYVMSVVEDRCFAWLFSQHTLCFQKVLPWPFGKFGSWAVWPFAGPSTLPEAVREFISNNNVRICLVHQSTVPKALNTEFPTVSVVQGNSSTNGVFFLRNRRLSSRNDKHELAAVSCWMAQRMAHEVQGPLVGQFVLNGLKMWVHEQEVLHDDSESGTRLPLVWTSSWLGYATNTTLHLQFGKITKEFQLAANKKYQFRVIVNSPTAVTLLMRHPKTQFAISLQQHAMTLAFSLPDAEYGDVVCGRTYPTSFAFDERGLFLTNDEMKQNFANNVMEKLDPTLTPTAVPSAGDWVLFDKVDNGSPRREYCLRLTHPREHLITAQAIVTKIFQFVWEKARLSDVTSTSLVVETNAYSTTQRESLCAAAETALGPVACVDESEALVIGYCAKHLSTSMDCVMVLNVNNTRCRWDLFVAGDRNGDKAVVCVGGDADAEIRSEILRQSQRAWLERTANYDTSGYRSETVEERLLRRLRKDLVDFLKKHKTSTTDVTAVLMTGDSHLILLLHDLLGWLCPNAETRALTESEVQMYAARGAVLMSDPGWQPI